MFPISRDPPEGGTLLPFFCPNLNGLSFQFLGIPPKGEQKSTEVPRLTLGHPQFPISRDPPEGGTEDIAVTLVGFVKFPISRDPPEGGTAGFYRRVLR